VPTRFPIGGLVALFLVGWGVFIAPMVVYEIGRLRAHVGPGFAIIEKRGTWHTLRKGAPDDDENLTPLPEALSRIYRKYRLASWIMMFTLIPGYVAVATVIVLKYLNASRKEASQASDREPASGGVPPQVGT